jgi:RHS repeat-associated protein
MASKTDWNGNKTTYVNNVYGFPTTINEAVGTSVARTTTIMYDPTWVHLPKTITTTGVTQGFTYDGFGETLTSTLTDTTSQTVPYSTNGQTRTTTFTYNNSLLASVQTPNLNTTYLGYSGTGALTSIKDALGHITNITSYTGGGLPETIVDPNGVTTTDGYDQRQRITSSSVSTAAGADNTTWTYYNDGDVATTLPDSSALLTLLDSAHRLGGIADNYNEQFDFTLDSNGDPTESYIQDRNGGTDFDRTAKFDALGRKLKDTSTVTNASIVWTYDKNGNPLTVTDQLSHKTTNVFDALNRLSKSTDANSGVVNFTYDAHDRPLTVKDKDANTTTYVYDGFGDMIQQASPDSGTTVYHYDPDANLTSKTDAASVVTNWTYDALDRVKTVAYPAASTLNVTNTYDQTGTGFGFGIGRLTSVTDAPGSLTRSYDERGNLLVETRTVATSIWTTTYTYNPASRVATIAYPSGSIVTYNRDATGRVTSIGFNGPGTDSNYAVTAATHMPYGPVNSITFNSHDTDNIGFDEDYRVTGITSNVSTYQANLAYGYDAANNLKTITDTITPANSQTLGYDVLNRLNSAVSGTGGYGSQSWTYDKNGNLTKSTGGGTTFTYNTTSGTNQLASITWTGNSQTYGYTATGNINLSTLNGTTNMFTGTYSNANRLGTALTNIGQSANYLYDQFGKRILKDYPGDPFTAYAYDQDGNTIEELDNGTGPFADYIYLEGRLVGDYDQAAHHMYFVHGDRIGTPLAATDVNDAINWQATYQPYGATQTLTQSGPTGAVLNNIRFPGQFFDHESGFQYNMTRDYLPGLGRYLEADPSGLGGGLNTYAYANDNPLKYTDFFGLETSQKEKREICELVAGVPCKLVMKCPVGTKAKVGAFLICEAATTISCPYLFPDNSTKYPRTTYTDDPRPLGPDDPNAPLGPNNPNTPLGPNSTDMPLGPNNSTTPFGPSNPNTFSGPSNPNPSIVVCPGLEGCHNNQ